MKKSFEGWLVTLSRIEREAAEERAAMIQVNDGLKREAAEQLVMKQWKEVDRKYDF